MKHSGFTLIELVVVIVILTILAVTAAPKFIDLTSDAEAAVTDTLKGTLHSAAKLVYAKSVVDSKEKQSWFEGDTPPLLELDGRQVFLHYGYPFITEYNATDQLAKILDSDINIKCARIIGCPGYDDPTIKGFSAHQVDLYTVELRNDQATDPRGCFVSYRGGPNLNDGIVVYSETSGC